MSKKIKALALVWAALAMGCAENPVVITYAQRMNFEVFDPDPIAQPHQTYGGGYTAMYIKSIENPAGSGKTYQFTPGKVYFNDPSQSGWDAIWQDQVLNAPWRAGDRTVAAGETATNLGCVVVRIEAEAKNYAIFLNHNGEEVPVRMVREGEAKANIFNPGTAFKETLEEQCQP
jgi:hypothetical protein